MPNAPEFVTPMMLPASSRVVPARRAKPLKSFSCYPGPVLVSRFEIPIRPQRQGDAKSTSSTSFLDPLPVNAVADK
jgi:hypothetical protein